MELMIFLFAIAAMVWMVPIIHRGKFIPVAMVMLVTGTVFGPPFFAIDGPIQISLDRVLWLGLMSLAVIQWRLGNLKLCKPTRTDWLLIGLTGFLLVSAISGAGSERDGSPIARWLFYIAMPLGTYAVARMVRLTAADLRIVLWSIFGLSVYLAGTGLLEVKQMHWAVFPKFINDPEVWEFYGRARGPLLNPIGNGVLMGIGLVIAVVEFVRAHRLGKLVFATGAMLIFAGIYATYTRSCWVGAMGAIALLVMIHSPRWVRVLGLCSVVLLCGAMMLGLKDQLLEIKRDKELSAAEAAKSVELRPLLAIVALEMFKDHPIVGHGYGQYFAHNGPYHDIRSYEMPLPKVRTYVQHNTFLAIAVDTGLIGILMFGGSLFVFFVTGWRLARNRATDVNARVVGMIMMSTLVIYFANGMFHDLVVIPMVQMFVMFVAGLTMNLNQHGVCLTHPATITAPSRVQRVVHLRV